MEERKRMKKFSILLLALLLVFGSVGNTFAESTVSLVTHDLLIEAQQTTLLREMDTQNISVTISNITGERIRNVVVKPSIANPTTVFINDFTATNLNSIYKGNPKSFSIPVRTLPTDKDVTVEISIQTDYEIGTLKKEILENPSNKTGTESDYDWASKQQSAKIYVIQSATKLPENSILEIKKIDSFPLGYVVPGENFNVAFEIYNPGNAPARNVKLMLEGLEPTGINMKTGLNTQDLTMIPAKSKATVFYELASPASAAGGMYQLNLKYSFVGKTPTGGETMAPVTGEYNFSVDMKKASMAPSTIIFDRVTFPKGQIGKNRNVDVSFTLKNIGTSKAQNLKISAVSENTAAVSPTSGSNAIVKELNPGQSAEYKFSFKTTNSATTGNYPVNFTVEYIDDSTTVDKPHKITQTVGINVIDWEAEALKNKDKPTSTPKLIVEKYEFIPNVIYAGTTFNMNLVLYNTNDTKTIENVKIFLTSETMQSSSTGSTTTTSASVFTPINSSNTFHIDSIAPGERIEKTITLGSSRDTAAKTYTVTANLEYEDRQANKFTSQEIIGVPVLQESKIGMGEITMDPQYTVGMPGNLSVDFYNTGKVALSNFMVNIEGEGIKADTPTYYKGNFPSGTSDTFSVNITPESPEATKGKIRFTFEDSTGESHEIEKEFTIEVMDMSEMYPEGMDPNMPPMPPEDQGGLPILPIAAGAAALGVGGFIFWRRRKVKKDEEDLTIDED